MRPLVNNALMKDREFVYRFRRPKDRVVSDRIHTGNTSCDTQLLYIGGSGDIARGIKSVTVRKGKAYKERYPCRCRETSDGIYKTYRFSELFPAHKLYYREYYQVYHRPCRDKHCGRYLEKAVQDRGDTENRSGNALVVKQREIYRRCRTQHYHKLCRIAAAFIYKRVSRSFRAAVFYHEVRCRAAYCGNKHSFQFKLTAKHGKYVFLLKEEYVRKHTHRAEVNNVEAAAAAHKCAYVDTVAARACYCQYRVNRYRHRDIEYHGNEVSGELTSAE